VGIGLVVKDCWCSVLRFVESLLPLLASALIKRLIPILEVVRSLSKFDGIKLKVLQLVVFLEDHITLAASKSIVPVIRDIDIRKSE